MNDTDWKSIPGKLQAAGFTVRYERISYEPSNPLWRATANREGRSWIALGKNLEAALIALDEQTSQVLTEWRETVPLEGAHPSWQAA